MDPVAMFRNFHSLPIHCRFTGATCLNRANTLQTTLEPHAVRDLLVHGQTEQRDFSGYDLRGISFAGLRLNGFNFHRANLNQADFRGADLTGADLSKVSALGAVFDSATLTGAIIADWNIDTETRFNRVVCKYVYLQRDQSQRNPPAGEFQDGEFTSLYQ